MADQTAYYNTRYQFDPRRSVVWKCICKWLEREIPGDSVVLEIGAGYCDFINNIKAKRKIALDLSDTLSERALPEVETHVGSCANLQFAADSSVDVVFASNLLEHLTMPQIEQTLSETLRVLKSGGKLVIIQPNFAYCSKVYFDDYTHIGIFTHRALADLFEASGFKVTRVAPKFMPFSIKSGGLPVHPVLIWLYLRSPIRPMAGQMLIVAQKL